MEPQMILISKQAVEHLITMMSRAEGYCRKARSMRSDEWRYKPTDSYPGATGYAGATLREAILTLESHI